jgi:hypothetical protein
VHQYSTVSSGEHRLTISAALHLQCADQRCAGDLSVGWWRLRVEGGTGRQRVGQPGQGEGACYQATFPPAAAAAAPSSSPLHDVYRKHCTVFREFSCKYGWREGVGQGAAYVDTPEGPRLHCAARRVLECDLKVRM